MQFISQASAFILILKEIAHVQLPKIRKQYAFLLTATLFVCFGSATISFLYKSLFCLFHEIIAYFVHY